MEVLRSCVDSLSLHSDLEPVFNTQLSGLRARGFDYVPILEQFEGVLGVEENVDEEKNLFQGTREMFVRR